MKAGAAICVVLALAVLGFWAATGMHFATRTQLPPEAHLSCETVADCGGEDGDTCTDGKCYDDFDEKKPGTAWREGFELGIVDGAGPAAGGLLGLAGLLFFLDRRKRKAG